MKERMLYTFTWLQTFFKRWWKQIVTISMLIIGAVFVWHDGPELASAIRLIPQTPWPVALLSFCVSLLYILCNSLIYVGSFGSVGAKLPLREAIVLWLRRNFISVFLPAGGAVSLLFYNQSLRKATASRPAMNQEQLSTGGLIFLAVGYGSLLLVALPVLILGIEQGLPGNSAGAFLALAILLAGLYYVFKSYYAQGTVFVYLEKHYPAIQRSMEQFRFKSSLNRRSLLNALVASTGVEVCGIAHVYLAASAIGHPVSFSLALTTYVIATLFFALSPVLRGLGAVETSMTIVLTQVGGFDLTTALAITLYYRLFEFWTPLLLGLLSFLTQKSNLLLRILPAFLTICVGIINLFSALTPGLPQRMKLLEGLLPTSVMIVSNYVVIGTGLVLLALAIGLMRGYRDAWFLTIGTISLSMVLHLTKAFDFEEAAFSGIVLFILLYTRHNYTLAVPSIRRLTRLPVRRRRTSAALVPTTRQTAKTAADILAAYGQGPLDYFKLYSDKELVCFPDDQAFVSYRLSGRYAVVLEKPVCPPGQLQQVVHRFDRLCKQHGYLPLYYRVDTADLPPFKALGKLALHIGEEGLVDLAGFSLEGRDHKSLRNALKRVQGAGFNTKIYVPPVNGGLIQQLRAVSDEWLVAENLRETAFSQGIFDAAELRQQTIITVEDSEGKVMAFVNIIPDYAPDEGTYDLIRKTNDAPSGAIDVLLVSVIQYGQQQGWKWLNLGLAPLSGLEDTNNLAEQAVKLAYERIRAFSHLKGLRAFKEKYATVWRDKFIVYNDDLDLVQASFALQQVGRYQPATMIETETVTP